MLTYWAWSSTTRKNPRATIPTMQTVRTGTPSSAQKSKRRSALTCVSAFPFRAALLQFGASCWLRAAFGKSRVGAGFSSTGTLPVRFSRSTAIRKPECQGNHTAKSGSATFSAACLCSLNSDRGHLLRCFASVPKRTCNRPAVVAGAPADGCRRKDLSPGEGSDLQQ